MLRREIALLKEKVDLLIRRIFGVKSEKLDVAQLELLLEQAQAGTHLGKAEASVEAAATSVVELLKARRRDKHQREPRERWPELPVIEEILEPEEVKANPGEFRCIGEEVSEQLDYQPAKFFRRRIIRRKFVSRREPELAPVIAPAPESLQQRCIAAPGLLAQIIVSKYCDHLPLYRQEQIYWNRHQVWLPRASQARWMGLAADWLNPIYQEIKSGVMAGGYVQVDETPIKYLEPGKGKTAQGYLWVASQPGGDVLFEWHTGRQPGAWEGLYRLILMASSNAMGIAATIALPATVPGKEKP